MDFLSAKDNDSWIVVSVKEALSPAIGRKFSLPIKMANVETAKKFGVTLNPAETTILEFSDVESQYRNRRLGVSLNSAKVWEQQLKRFRVVSATVPECLWLLASRLNFRFALEGVAPNLSATNRLMERISIDRQDIPLTDVFDAIIEANPAYTYDIFNGLVRFHSLSANTSKSYFLTKKIAAYQLDGVSSSEATDVLIKNMQPLQPALKFNNLTTPAKDAFGNVVLLKMLRKDISPREVLDTLSEKVKASWMVSPAPGKEGLGVFVGTAYPILKEVLDQAKVEIGDRIEK